MKKVIIYMLALTTTSISYSQMSTEQKITNQIQETLDLQVQLLEIHKDKLNQEIEKLKQQYDTYTKKELPQKKEKKKKKPSYANIEAIVGITDNEGIGYQGNFSIELDKEATNGLEMGLFFDSNDILLANDIEIASEIFILNLGYTKQVNFLSNQSRTVTTRFALGGAIGAEVLNDGEKELKNGALLETEGGLIYGGYAGLLSLFKINNKFSAVFRTSNYITTSDVSLHKFIVGAGIRYNF